MYSIGVLYAYLYAACMVPDDIKKDRPKKLSNFTIIKPLANLKLLKKRKEAGYILQFKIFLNRQSVKLILIEKARSFNDVRCTKIDQAEQ